MRATWPPAAIMSKMYSTANLSDKELKEQGNRLFNLRKYEDAASCYTKAIVSVMTFFVHAQCHTSVNRNFGLSRIFVHLLCTVVIAAKYFLFWITNHEVCLAWLDGSTVFLAPGIRTRIWQKRGRFKLELLIRISRYSYIRNRQGWESYFFNVTSYRYSLSIQKK